MDRLTTSRLARANADRLKHVDAVKSYDLELGRLAKAAIDADEYTTQSAVARVLGVSHTHVRNLIDAAEAAGTELAGDADRAVGIPMLANELAGEYVQSRGARILRSISGFREPDVLFSTTLDPRLFAADGRCMPPAMMWHLDNGEWVGVTKATVGYGGAGCTYSIHALQAAGLDEDTAMDIVGWRYCDAVNVADRSTWVTQNVWPVHARTVPMVIDKMLDAVRCAIDSLGSRFTMQYTTLATTSLRAGTP